MTLEEFFAANPEAAMGFSGGVDSSYLLYAGTRWGKRIGAYYVKTAFQPRFELEDAKRLAREVGAELRILELDVLADEAVRANPKDRCYFCKQRIFSAIRRQAEADGFALLMDGTNASDDASDRPGMKALEQMRVVSPLRLCGLSKAEIRRRSREAGLFTWDKPAYACLATRIPAGRPIDGALLDKVERGEEALFSLGFTDFRLRVLGEDAKLQVPAAQMERAVAQADAIRQALTGSFRDVLLDLKSR